jgi:hypothetical protein
LHRIFAFVDALTQSKLSLMLISDFLIEEAVLIGQIGLGTSEYSRCQWLLVLHPVSPDSIDCSDTGLHLDRYDSGDNVIASSSDNIMDFGSVRFKTLFFLPCPKHIGVGESIKAKLLGLYKDRLRTQNIYILS